MSESLDVLKRMRDQSADQIAYCEHMGAAWASDLPRHRREHDALETAIAALSHAAGQEVEHKLLADLHLISTGELPDGDGVDTSVSLWAERWLARLSPAVARSEGEES